jgi:AcrR family transcriptional regulator
MEDEALPDHPSPPPRDTRARIQQAALELFVRNGYEKTSLREISDRLGVTKAALYYHFASKQELLKSITDPLIEELEDLLDQGPSAEELLARYVDLLSRNRPVFEIFMTDHASLVAAEIAERSLELRRRMIHSVAGPDPKPVDLIRSASAIGAVTQGYMSAARLDPAHGFDDVDPADLPDHEEIKELLIGVAGRILGTG